MPALNKHIVSGRINAKPELRYTPNGVPVTSFGLARQPRRLNPQTNQWEDGDLTWYDVTVFKRLAENVVASLDKGVEVTVTGELKLNSYTGRDGQPRTSLEILADDVSITLDHQIAQVTDRSAYGNKVSGGTGSGNAPVAGGNAGGYSSAPADDDTPF